MKEDPGSEPHTLVVSPFRFGLRRPLGPLIAAEVLRRFLTWQRRSCRIAVGLSHGGLWGLRKAGPVLNCPEGVRAARREFEAGLTRCAESLDLTSGDRVLFTLDPVYRDAAAKAVCALFQKGLLSRKGAVVPWCSVCRTGLDPDRKRTCRVVERPGWEVLVTVKGAEKPLPCRFSRLERVGACVGLAVHPDDERLAPLAGKTARLPLYGREVKFVSTSYETEPGCVRPLFPAYDQGDLKIAVANKLQVLDVLTEEGTIGSAGGRYAGLKTSEAAEQIREALGQCGALGRAVAVKEKVALCEICGHELTWRYREEWFIQLGTVRDAVEESGILKRIEPGSFRRRVLEEAKREVWCISRRCEYGVGLPVWYCSACGEYFLGSTSPRRCLQCGSAHFLSACEKLSASFLSSLLPLVAAGYSGGEEERPGKPIDTLFFAPGEAEQAYFTLCMLLALAPQAVPRHVCCVGTEGRCVDPVLSEAEDSEARCIAELGGGLLGQGEVGELLAGFRRFTLEHAGRGASVCTEPGRLPLAERYLLTRLRWGAYAVEGCLRERRLRYAGALLVSAILRPVVEVYAPLAREASQEALSAVLYELCMYALPYVSLFAPRTASKLWRAAFGRDMAASSFPRCTQPVREDRRLLRFARTFFRLVQELNRDPRASAQAALRCLRSAEGTFRQLAAAFRQPALSAAFDRPPCPETVYRAELFGPVVLLLPASPEQESNVEAVIERIRRKYKVRQRRPRSGTSALTELIAELRRFAGEERPRSGSRKS